MKNIFFILFIILGPSTILAQVQNITLESGYTQQVFFNLETKASTIVKNDSWDIAFSSLGRQDAGIFINEGVSAEGKNLVVQSPTSDWSSAVDTTGFSEFKVLYNAEEKWDEGAFNTIKDTSSAFDYGWGSYNPQTHQIEGNKVYLVQQKNGNLLKFQVEKLTGGTYSIKYANLDGSDEKTAEIKKTEDDKKPLVLFSFASDSTFIPEDYDLIFGQYTTPLMAGPSIIEYGVTGVLLAPGTSAVVADSVDVDSVRPEPYLDQLSTHPRTIGYKWKSFSFETGFSIDEDRVQFVQTKDNKLYKIIFLDFEGSATGNMAFDVQEVTVTPVSKAAISQKINVYPNPFTDHIKIDIGDLDATNMTLIDNLGRVVVQQNLNATNHIQLQKDLPKGLYRLLLFKNQNIIYQKNILK